MKITAIPREDINSVSTRVHYYYYLENLPRDITWKPHKKKFGDILYIQKKADNKTIKIAKKAKKRKVPVVYDCDDNPYEREGKKRITMLRLADAVTTDTKERAEQLKRASGIKRVYIIPECVDYWDRMKTIPIREKMEKMITFGNNANAVNAVKYMKHVDLECFHINAKEIKGAGTFIKWELNTFMDELYKADVCILIHGDNMKSNLKLLVCLAVGMPTIVSDTKHYGDVFRSIGLDCLIVKKPEDVRQILKDITPKKVRENIVQQYNKYNLYTPEYSSNKLAHVFRKLKDNKCLKNSRNITA